MPARYGMRCVRERAWGSAAQLRRRRGGARWSCMWLAFLGELWVGSGRQKVHAANEAVTELEVRIKLLGLKLLGLKPRGVIPTTRVAVHSHGIVAGLPRDGHDGEGAYPRRDQGGEGVAHHPRAALLHARGEAGQARRSVDAIPRGHQQAAPRGAAGSSRRARSICISIYQQRACCLLRDLQYRPQSSCPAPVPAAPATRYRCRHGGGCQRKLSCAVRPTDGWDSSSREQCASGVPALRSVPLLKPFGASVRQR